MTIRHIYEAGDTVIVEGDYAGTQTGPLVAPSGTIPATDRFFSSPFADVFTVSGGKIIRHAAYLGQYGVPRSLALQASRSGSHNLPAELLRRRALVE
jgi:ketosteroid isomerase-like protein